MKFWPKHYLVRGFVDCIIITSDEAHRSTVWCPMMVEHKSGAKSQVGNDLDENGRLILKWNVTLTRHWLCNCSAFRAKGPRQKKKIWEYSTHSNLSNALSNSFAEALNLNKSSLTSTHHIQNVLCVWPKSIVRPSSEPRIQPQWQKIEFWWVNRGSYNILFSELSYLS